MTDHPICVPMILQKRKIKEVFPKRACYTEAADARVDAPVQELFDQCWEDDRRDVHACASS